MLIPDPFYKQQGAQFGKLASIGPTRNTHRQPRISVLGIKDSSVSFVVAAAANLLQLVVWYGLMARCTKIHGCLNLMGRAHDPVPGVKLPSTFAQLT